MAAKLLLISFRGVFATAKTSAGHRFSAIRVAELRSRQSPRGRSAIRGNRNRVRHSETVEKIDFTTKDAKSTKMKMRRKAGLLINFNVIKLKDGIHLAIRSVTSSRSSWYYSIAFKRGEQGGQPERRIGLVL